MLLKTWIHLALSVIMSSCGTQYFLIWTKYRRAILAGQLFVRVFIQGKLFAQVNIARLISNSTDTSIIDTVQSWIWCRICTKTSCAVRLILNTCGWGKPWCCSCAGTSTYSKSLSAIRLMPTLMWTKHTMLSLGPYSMLSMLECSELLVNFPHLHCCCQGGMNSLFEQTTWPPPQRVDPTNR